MPFEDDSTAEARAPRPRWLRIAGRVLGVALVALSLFYLGINLLRGLEQVPVRSLRPSVGPLVASLGLTVLCVALGGWNWRLLLMALGYQVPLRRCVAIQATSNLAKYVPGYAWQLLGKGYLTRREGVPTAAAAYAVLLEMGVLWLTGVALALVAWPAGLELPVIGVLGRATQLAAAGVAWALVALLPLIARWLGSTGWRWLAPVPRPAALWKALGVQVASWLLFGVAFGCLVGAFQPLKPTDWALSVFSLVASFVVSLVAVFVPAGLGVREGVMAATLGARLAGGLPVVVALLSRVVLTASELAAWALARLWLLLARDKGSITQTG